MLTAVRDALFVTALCVSFLAQAIPYGFPLFSPVVVLLLSISLLCSAWSRGLRGIRVSFGLFLPLLLSSVLVLCYGVLLTGSPDSYVLGDVVNGIAVLVLAWVAANIEWDRARLQRFLTRYIWALFCVGLTAGAIGLYKFHALLNGQTVAFVADAAGASYPAGTSLVADYNFYSLTILAAMLCGVHLLVETRNYLVKSLLMTALIGLGAAGLLSGSRRFFIATPILIVMAMLLALRRRGLRVTITALGAGLVPLVAVGALIYVAYGPIDWAAITTGWALNERLLGAVNLGTSLSSRFVRWEFAIGLLDGWTPWVGRGFDYLRIYGCEFSACSQPNYPHNPLISSMLIGGLAGLASTLLLLGYVFVVAARTLRERTPAATASLVLLATFLFVSISSNSILSVKAFLTATLACVVVIESLRRSRPSSSEPSSARISGIDEGPQCRDV